MNFLLSCNKSQATEAGRETVAEEMLAEDEIMDEALLEAVIGTGLSSSLLFSGSKSGNSIAHRHRYKHQ